MKKIIAVFVMLCILSASTCVGAVSLNGAQKGELYSLGIMTGDENGNLRLDDTITRAETVKMLCVAAGLNPVGDGEQPFSDVDDEHWARGYICRAKEEGIINGDENGLFNPEDSVTNEEIVKMLVCLIGHGAAAEMRGGFPAGYTALATRLGITAGLELAVNSKAIRNDVGLMVLQTLDVPIMIKDDDEGEEMYILADGNNGAPFITLRSKTVK